jgi:endonuclease-3
MPVAAARGQPQGTSGPDGEALRRKANAVYAVLTETYGLLELKPRRQPMHELISTILSHRTTHADEETAYHRMWERFGSWEGIRDAPVEELAEAIRTTRWPERKAPQIKAVLATIIAERGEASIDFLADLPVEEGMHWLMALPGVGLKTASLVLLFCFAKPILPVDTHVHRVSQRVGLIGPAVNPALAHTLLLALFPADAFILFNFHKAALRHGQQICTFCDPDCERCPVLPLCDYGRRRLGLMLAECQPPQAARARPIVFHSACWPRYTPDACSTLCGKGASS